jgi:hypothetical protein
MRISKNACRKYIAPGLTISPGSGLLCVKEIKYIVRTAVKNIAGKRTLLLYFIDREKAVKGDYTPIYTIFQAMNDYITWHQTDKESGKWLTSCLDNINCCYENLSRISAFYSPNDEARITRFCAVPEKIGFNALQRKQSSIMAERRKLRTIAREEPIIEIMKRVPAAPRDIRGFFHREVLPAYIFYTYHKSKKLMEGYCSACRHDVLVTGARHNLPGECPRCKRKITFKAKSWCSKLYDRSTAQVIQRISDDELIIRIYKGSKSYGLDFRNPREQIRENARFFIRFTDKGFECQPFYFSYNRGILTHWHNGERPRQNMYCDIYENEVCGYLYHRNLDTVLAGTPLEYCRVKGFYLHEREPLETIPYMRAYLKYPMIEYLVKLRLTNIVSYVVYRNRINDCPLNLQGKSMREVLGVSPQDIPMLQEVNPEIKQLKLFKELREQNISFDADLLRWYKGLELVYTDGIPYVLQFTTAMKLMRYIKCQHEKLKDIIVNYSYRRYENPGRVFSEYEDYLKIAEKLDYNLKSNFVLFPRDLQKAHDRASKLYQARKTKIQETAIQTAYANLQKQYRFTQNGLTIIPPKTASEIVSEGHALHHCVGNFLTEIADGKRIVLFLRKTTAKKKPFCTIELRGGQISQARGQNNADAPPEVKEFLEVFKTKVLQAVSHEAAA